MNRITICIDVPDLEQATRFYSVALDCEKVREEPPNSVILSAVNVEICLLKRVVGSRPLAAGTTVRTFERHWTPIHLDFGVSDLAASVVRVIDAGGTHEGTELGEGAGIAYCADPFGNGFCLINEPGGQQ